MRRASWWSLALAAATGLGACADEEQGARCTERTLGAPDSVVVVAGGAECLVAGADSAWEFNWRLPVRPGTGYAIRAFRLDSGAAAPWEGGLQVLRRPVGGGIPTTAVTPWGTYGPLDDRVEVLFAAETDEELLVRLSAARPADAGRIAIVVSRCVALPIVPPDTFAVIELAAGCPSRSFEPARLSTVTFVTLRAVDRDSALIHVMTTRTTGGHLRPIVAGPGLDIGCRVAPCWRREYPTFNGTLAHYIDPPVSGRYTYLVGVATDSAGLARIEMVPVAP